MSAAALFLLGLIGLFALRCRTNKSLNTGVA
jgi:hypothetical protein